MMEATRGTAKPSQTARFASEANALGFRCRIDTNRQQSARVRYLLPNGSYPMARVPHGRTAFNLEESHRCAFCWSSFSRAAPPKNVQFCSEFTSLNIG